MSNVPVKLLFVTDRVPHDRHGGGGVTELGIARLLAGNPAVSLSLLCLREEKNLHGTDSAEIRSEVGQIFETIFVLPARANKSSEKQTTWVFSLLGVRFSLQKFRSGFLYSFPTRGIVAAENYDLVISYGWDAAQATSRTKVRKIALLGDPLTLPYISRKYLFPSEKWRWRHRLLLKIEDFFLRTWAFWSCRRILRGCWEVGAFAAHHARDYQRVSGRQVTYVQTPVDIHPVAKLSGKSRSQMSPGSSLSLGMIGHLNGTATLQGLSEFECTLLPGLVSDLESGSVSLKIAGGYVESMPLHLRQSFEASGADFMGQVWPPESFFESIDVLVVPTSIPLGIRVRILTAMSMGVPVFAHAANKAGIPELEDGNNSLLYSSSTEFFAKLEILRNLEVRESLAFGGKKTISSGFSHGDDGAGNWLYDLVDSLTTA
jgi:glycosyltransferase involved in cell wall biosynthesis